MTGGVPTLRSHILARIREGVSVQASLESIADQVAQVADIMVRTLQRGNKLVFFGNGGSAADAQHLAAELVGKFYVRGRRALPAIALTVNTSVLTAIANDFSYDDVFARQVEALGREGDMAVGLTTSGNSENVVRGIDKARSLGMITIGMTDASGGLLKTRVDRCLCIPSDSTPRIQEAHILLGHILCEIVEGELARDQGLP